MISAFFTRVKYNRGVTGACGFNFGIMKSWRVFRGTVRSGDVLQYFCYYNVKFVNNEGFKLKLGSHSATAWCVNYSCHMDHLLCLLFAVLKLQL